MPNRNLHSLSGNFNRLPRTDSEKKFQDDLRAYELFNNGLKSRLSDNASFIKPSDLNRSGSGNSAGFRRHKVTSVNRYYSSNNPNPIVDTTTDITSYKY